MGKPEDAFKLLSTTDMREAIVLAEHLEKINNERKGTVAALVKDAKKHLEAREKINSVIVVGNPEWRPSLAGLVANSLVEEYERPVFVWGRDGDNILKGSCRSYNGYDLFQLMNAAKDSFIEFGGHAGAGGFSVTLEQIVMLEEKLSEIFSSHEVRPRVNKNLISKFIPLELSHIGEDLWKTVEQFAPFGMENPKPVFKISKAEIKSAKNFGKTGDHLEIIFENPAEPGRSGVKAISFFNTIENTKVSLEPNSHINLTAHLEKSYFRNRPEVRLRIVEIMA
jgi:single-stranded-DNA-specific exonuclease